MLSQKASDIENIKFGAFSRSINSNLQLRPGVSVAFSVTPTSLVLITGKKSLVLFVLSEIIDLKNQEKKRRKKQKISGLTEFHPSLNKTPKPAYTYYLSSLYPYPCSLNILS